MSVINLSDVRLFLKTYRLAHERMDSDYRRMQGLMKALRPLMQVSACAVLRGYYQKLEGCLQDCQRVNQKAASILDHYSVALQSNERIAHRIQEVLRYLGGRPSLHFRISVRDYAFLLQDQINTYDFLSEQHGQMYDLLHAMNSGDLRRTVIGAYAVNPLRAALKAPTEHAQRVAKSLKPLEGHLAQIPSKLFYAEAVPSTGSFERLLAHCKRWGSHAPSSTHEGVEDV